MARWIYNRPLANCDEVELEVAKRLTHLGEDWMVRWGFYYDRDREGDFLILGPVGGVLVLEVKGGPLRKLAATGRWDGSDRDHPVAQLSAEWKAVIKALETASDGRGIPFVTKALCLPEITLPADAKDYKGIDRSLIVDANDLADFGTTWQRLFAEHAGRVRMAGKDAFIAAYAQETTPATITQFITETDKILLRHATQEFELLDMLRENRQLLVQGGPGTGKTWLAFEQAYRWSEQGKGQRVLLLCYNLALARTLESMVARRKPARGGITVRSWEGLARELFASAKVKWQEPQDYEARRCYFAEKVPQTLRGIVHDPRFKPRFDALVVDEAQDHDTTFAGEKPEGDEVGWWSVYFKYLHEGRAAPVAAFFDPGQRPLFRDPAVFDAGRLRGHLSGAVHVHLTNALRYTRPVFGFLKGLKSEATSSLVNELRHRGCLPDGPEVALHEAAPDQVASKVGDIVSSWIADGFCRADDILILSPRSAKARSSLARTTGIGAWKLAEHDCKQPGEISYLSVNKAKGLDSLAVVLVDVAPFDKLRDGQDQMDYFMGASRARQLLVVVHGG